MYTINQILDRYERERLPLKKNKRTQRDYAWHIVKLREHFGTKLAIELTPEHLTTFTDVDEGVTNRVRSLAVLSTALTSAVKWRMVTHNIVREVERPKSKSRTRIVTDKEIAGIKQKTGPRLACAVDLARLTGMRQGAITQLRWDQVHVEDRVILTRHYVTNKRIEIPITKEVQAVLDKCRKLPVKKPSDYVIPTRFGESYTNDGFRACWQRLIRKWRKGGHDNFTFNDITMTALRERKRLAQQLPQDDDIISKFDAVVRNEAIQMAQQYKVFYCLEKSIRKMVTEEMEAAYGRDWFNTNVDPAIKKKTEEVRSMEIDAGLPPRSDSMLDYTTFGQLRQIISQNWTDVFSKKLKTDKQVTTVMTTLNRVRGSIAHFSVMSDYEIERLEFTVKGWFELLVTE